MLAREDDDAEPGAGSDIDMRIDAALADQLKLRQSLQQRCADLRPLADQDQGFGVAQSLRQLVDILDVIVPDRDVMSGKLLEAVERAQGVEIIVEDGNLHGQRPPRGLT